MGLGRVVRGAGQVGGASLAEVGVNLGRVAGRLSGGRWGTDLQIKSRGEVQAMRAAGLVVAATLERVVAAAVVGATTADLDALAESTIREAGAVPSFLGYHGFPGSICTSVNAQVVHGIPGADTVLVEGDLISVDCGAILDGWHGDAAVTVDGRHPAPRRRRALGRLPRGDVGGDRRGPARQPPRRRLARGRGGVPPPPRPPRARASGSSRTTAATASAPRCTWSRSCRTSGVRARACGCARAWCWRSSRC